MFLYLTGRCSVAAKKKRKKCGSDWINKKKSEMVSYHPETRLVVVGVNLPVKFAIN